MSEQIKLNECLENIDSNNVNLKKHKLEINDSIDKLTNIINSNIRDKNFSEAWVNLAKIKFYNNHLNHIEKYISL